jgi:hypothetical protein
MVPGWARRGRRLAVIFMRFAGPAARGRLIKAAPRNGRTRPRVRHAPAPVVFDLVWLIPITGRTRRVCGPGRPVVFDFLWLIATKGRTRPVSGPGRPVVFDLTLPMQTKGRTLGHSPVVSPPRKLPGRPAQPPSSPSPSADRATANRPLKPRRPRVHPPGRHRTLVGATAPRAPAQSDPHQAAQVDRAGPGPGRHPLRRAAHRRGTGGNQTPAEPGGRRPRLRTDNPIGSGNEGPD